MTALSDTKETLSEEIIKVRSQQLIVILGQKKQLLKEEI